MESQPVKRLSFRFPAAFRLKRKRLIRSLFDRSRDDVESSAKGCIRIVYRLVPRENTTVPLQVGFTVGRSARRAVDRNRIKRYLRESFRLNQHELTDSMAVHDESMLTMMIIFRGRPDQAQHLIPRHLPTVMQIVASKIGNDVDSA